MRKVMSCFGTVSGRCALTILALFAASTALLHFAPGVSAASKGPVFGREVIVDHQRVAGEPSISIDSQDRIYVAAPVGFSTTASFVWRSTDHGQSFHLVPCDPAQSSKPMTIMGDGDSAHAVDTANRLYFADLQGLTNVSNSVSSDQGATWLTTCNATNDVGVDRPWIATFKDPQNGGALYQTVDQIGQCVGACEQNLGQVGANVVEITRSQDGVTFTPLPGQQIEPDGIVSGIVSSSSQIYMAVSTDHGAHWGAPVRVTAATPTLQTNLFPWIAAGDPGRVDIVWYGTPTLGSCPSQPCGSSGIQAHWSVMMAQSLNTVVNGAPNARPSFTTSQVSEVSNHFGAICTMGLGCTTGGDRGLLDFLSVTVGLKGEANVVWADAVNSNFSGGTSSALIAFNRQIAGPSLYASVGQVTGPAPASGSASGSPDAFYSANGTITPASSNLVISSASVTMPDAQHYRFKINVQNLSTLAVLPTLGGTDAVWLVRWEVPDPNGAGHTYFAAMESDAGQAPSFFDGETSSINTTHGKFLTYPGAHSIQGSFTMGGPGVITVNVPVADVGGNSKATLFSITGLTVTQATASSTGDTIFNQIDATAPFDFKP